jgi:hypothetical protein
MLPKRNMRCCLIAAACAQFPVQFADLVEAVLHLCQYSSNIPGSYQAQQKWLYAGGVSVFAAALWFD